MVERLVEDIIPGAILAEDVYLGNTLICRKGVPVSEHLKISLPKFDIHTVKIESIVSESIDEKILDFDAIKNISYFTVKHLDIDGIILCAKSLVNSILNHKDNKFLNILFEYDECTYRHSINVANLAVAAGVSMGLSLQRLRDLALGSLLHDIGKVEIPPDILNKNGKLTDYEYSVIKEHPWLGYRLVLGSDEVSSSVKQIIYQHHENYDGSGYPKGLFKMNSFKLARLVHICDVYEALCAERPYKNALPRRTVRKIMFEGSGSLFDPVLLSQFMECIPLYMVGESIKVGSKIGIVVDTVDSCNPDIYCAGELYKLDKFEELNEVNIDIMKDVD